MIRIQLYMLLALIWASSLYGQQDAQYTQYMYNTATVNPAYAGSRRVLSLTALHRSQWVGVDGSPTTQTLNVSFPAGERGGLAFSIFNDEILNNTKVETNFDLAYSYTIKAGEKGKLAFGLNFGANLLSVNYTELAGYVQEQGASMLSNIDKRFAPNFGSGIYYYTPNFYLGLSAPDFLENQYFDSAAASTSYIATERINWYLIAGKVFELNRNLKFKPAMLLKAVEGAPLQVDLSANFLFNEKFSFGTAYRWNAGISAVSNFQINSQLMLGLAYDREVTDLGNLTFNNGSFEIVLRYEFLETCNCTWLPRFF